MLYRFASPLCAALLLAGCATTQSPVAKPAAPPEAGFVGAVSSADPRAQEAGMAMLRDGGNATDAAIATMLALTVVEPQSSGIGGGGFLVRGTAEGAAESFDGRETAPQGAGPDWFLLPDGSIPEFRESVHSGLSVGVPGNVALAALVHAQHGRLPWAKLFEPAIALARGGFQINERLHGYLARLPEHAGWSQTARALYYESPGEPYPAGHLVVNERLANTFEAIAAAGPSAFYSGPIASEIAATVAANTPREGAMTARDLATYRAKEREPVCGNYRGYRVCGMGPPTSGGVAVLQILGMVERFDLAELGVQNPVTWHLFLEAQRLAYADREIYLADSDFVSVPIAGLIDPDYIAQRSELISPESTIAEVRAGTPVGVHSIAGDGNEPVERGTSHIAAVDAANTMVSYTSTIEGPFGSGLMAGGFYLNNELTDFSRSPRAGGRLVANRVAGGKRPRSSMSPMVVWDPQGRPFLMVGAAGGSTIPVTTARSIIGAIDFDLSAEEALAMPFTMARGDSVMVEEGTWMEAAIPAFKALGHTKVSAREAPIKGGAIRRGPEGWDSARDPRIESGLDVP